MSIRRAILGLFTLLLLVCTTQAVLVNRTIDDTYGDPTTGRIPVYQPNGAWNGPNCTGCAINPSPSLAFDGTWSAATYNPGLNNTNITFSFTGVAIWIFFIIANANALGPSITSNTNCNFTLDGILIGSYNHQPDENTEDLQYNVTVFSASSLSNDLHEMVISTNDYPTNVYLDFDYAIYTADEPDNTTSSTSGSSSTSTPASAVAHNSSSNSKVGIIVGCVLGSLALVVLVAVLIFFRRKRRKPQRSTVLTEASIATFGNQQSPMGYRNGISVINSHLPSGSTYNENTGSGTLYDQSNHIRSPSFDLAQSPTLVPFRREYQPSQLASSTKSQDELRPLRQLEAHQRLQSAQLEMHDLQSMYSSLGAASSSSDVRRPERDHELETIREQIRQLSNQMENMQVDRSMDWGQRSNRTSEPPPAYD